MLSGNTSYTIGESVYFPCHICKEHAFMGWAAELSMWNAPMKYCKIFSYDAKRLILLLLLNLVLRFWYPQGAVRYLICSQCLQDDMANGSLPRQYETGRIQPNSGLTRQPGGLPWLPFTVRPVCTGVGNTCTRTWTYGGMLSSAMSPDSAYCSWIMQSKCGVYA